MFWADFLLLVGCSSGLLLVQLWASPLRRLPRVVSLTPTNISALRVFQGAAFPVGVPQQTPGRCEVVLGAKRTNTRVMVSEHLETQALKLLAATQHTVLGAKRTNARVMVSEHLETQA